MSAPSTAACAFAALALGLPLLAAGAHLEARHRAAGAADAAALAAADAAAGWVEGEPCALAAELAEAARVRLSSCTVDTATAEARVTVSVRTPIGSTQMRSRAGPWRLRRDGGDGKGGKGWRGERGVEI